jgi:hypothetical protein
MKKIALAITLISIMFASTFMPAIAMAEAQFLDWDGSQDSERQMAVPGILYDELFPEWNHTYWQKNSLTVGFTEFGETVTDQDPLGEGSDYGVGLTYPSVPADQYDPDATNVYVVEHIACPTISGGPSPGGLIYIPVEGWQLFWKWKPGSVGYNIDPSWHISMAIYGNHSAPFGTRARLDVKLASELGYEPMGMKVITDTSRLFAAKTHFYTYNETLLTELALDPVVFEIELIYVFFKNTKKLVQFWTVQYLRSEYGAVDIVFRRLTDWSVDNKFQDFQNENFACMFPSSVNVTNQIYTGPDGSWVNKPWGCHALWGGCDYWPQNYTLGLAWTNSTIEHWDPEDAQHHVAFIAYYPNCSNWDTDNWSWYLTNMWTQWKKNQGFGPMGNTNGYQFLDPDRTLRSLGGWNYYHDEADNGNANWWGVNDAGTGPTNNWGPLSVRYDGQPRTNEFLEYGDRVHFAASPLMMGQWNFTLTSATAKRMAKFVNVMGVTNCSDTFGYVNDKNHPMIGHYAGDWDSLAHLSGGRTLSEIKYLVAEVFNATYKLSSNWDDVDGDPLDVSQWYPFAGVQWRALEYVWNNTWIKKDCGWTGTWLDGWMTVDDESSRNCTFIYGDSEAHNGMVFTSEGSHVVDVVGGTEVGMDFGSYISNWKGNPATASPDPWFEAMWDTSDFMGQTIGPFVPEVGAPDFFFEQTQETYLDPLPTYSPVGPIETDLQKTALRRMSARRADCGWRGDTYTNYFTTPTGCGWNLTHIVAVGGPKVNLATEYFNEHTWAIWTSDESGTEFEELEDGGIYVFPSGNYYTGDGWSVITIVEDLNLTSWNAIYDEELLETWQGGCVCSYDTDGARAGIIPWCDWDPIVDGPTIYEPYAALLIWGTSGWDTRAAANWFAQYRQFFSDTTDLQLGTGLATNATLQPSGWPWTGRPKLGATTIILHTEHIQDSCNNWLNGVAEILGPCAGRWRLSETAWNVWIAVPLSIEW